MAKLLFALLYFFGLTTQEKSTEKYHMTYHRSVWHHIIELHNKCGKVVHRPCSSCISSIQELNKNSIKFFLLTWTWNIIKLS